jgi:hypothetical protein
MEEDRRLSLGSATLQILQDFHAAAWQAVLAPARMELPEDAFVFSPATLGAARGTRTHFMYAYRELADRLGIRQPPKNPSRSLK